MAAINLRLDKERPLTIQEVDDNFFLINQEVGLKLDTLSFTATNILSLLDGNAGAGSTLDADKVQGQYPDVSSTANTVAIRDALGNLYANQFLGQHVGPVVGNVTGNLTGTVTGNASNVDGIVQIEHGGTGAGTAATARSNIGCGNMAVQNKNSIDITGGTITGITDITVADGGTGASNASGARTNLGLAIGLDVQAYNALLAGLSGTSGNGWLIRSTTGAAYVRTLQSGNSIEITNKDGTAGDPTISLALNPSISAITKVGTASTGNIGQSDNAYATAYINTTSVTSIEKRGTNGSGDIGQTGNRFATIYGKSTSAQYADLAEKYTTDKHYEPGTVIVVSYDDKGAEATQSFAANQRVLGVVSTNPAHVMNDESTGQAIGLTGRLPVKVTGAIRKGQPIVSTADGKAAFGDNQFSFGIALETNLDPAVKLVECVIK